MKVVKKEAYVSGDKIKLKDQFPEDANLDKHGFMLARQGQVVTVLKGTSELPDDGNENNGVFIVEDTGERQNKYLVMVGILSGMPEDEARLAEHWFWDDALIEGAVVEE